MTAEHRPSPKPLSLEEITFLSREMVRKEGHHVPTVFAQGGGESVMGQLQRLGESHDERCQQMRVSGYLLGQSGELPRLEEVCLICEAWLSLVTPGETMDVLPSQDPKRKEVLMISNLTVATHQAKVVILEMIRDTQGVVELQELSLTDSAGGSVESPLLDAFIEGFRIGKAGNN